METPKNKTETPSINRRPATAEDTELALKIHHAAYHDVIVRQFGNFDEKEQDQYFAKSWNPETFEIIESEKDSAGYCSIERAPDYIFAHELVIKPEFQGKGIGSQLLKEIIAEANTRNVPIKLQVLKENKAQDLYKKFGFTQTGETDTHVLMEFGPAAK